MDVSVTPDKIQLEFYSSTSSPLAYKKGTPISVLQFKNDVRTLTDTLDRLGDGKVLITATGRYAFSVALIAAWSTGKKVILPPDQHESTLNEIRDSHRIVFECDSSWSRQLPGREFDVSKDLHTSWSVELDAGLTLVEIYTSGSTGSPCPVDKKLANLFEEVICIDSVFDWPDGTVVGTVPAQHLYGLTFTVLLPMIKGLPWVDDVPLFPQDVFKVIDQTQARTLVSVPVHYHSLLQSRFQSENLFCLSATSLLDEQTANRWNEINHCQIVEIFGSTETGIIGYRQQLDDIRWTKFSPVKLTVQPDLLEVCSPFTGSDSSRAVKTADRIELSGDDRFLFHGRTDRIVKIGGKRTSLSRIERSLIGCTGVLDARAIAVPAEGRARDNVVWAVVATAKGTELSAAHLRTELRKKLEDTSIPKRFVFVDQLPRNATGKICRDSLAAMFKSARALRV